MNRNLRSVSFVATLLLALTSAQQLSAGTGSGRSGSQSSRQSIQHVLLISIDGMHALDFINCANGNQWRQRRPTLLPQHGRA